jgi:hypothetical protein
VSGFTFWFTLIVPIYPSGRRVWLWIRCGTWWVHAEVWRWSVDAGWTVWDDRDQPWLAWWQRGPCRFPERRARMLADLRAHQ